MSIQVMREKEQRDFRDSANRGIRDFVTHDGCCARCSATKVHDETDSRFTTSELSIQYCSLTASQVMLKTTIIEHHHDSPAAASRHANRSTIPSTLGLIR